MAQNKWQIVGGVGVHGQCMIATNDISPGELIMSEQPLIICNSKKTHSWWKKHSTQQFYTDEEKGVTDQLDEAYNLLGAAGPAQASLLALHGVVPADSQRDRVRQAFEYNAFNLVSPNHKCVYLVVYELISRINHSCVPNAVVAIDKAKEPNRGQARLIATCDILNGAEIFISYMAAEWHAGVTERTEQLKHYRFTCACRACDVARDMDIQRRPLAHELQKMLINAKPARDLPDSERNERIGDLGTYVDLLLHLGLWDHQLV